MPGAPPPPAAAPRSRRPRCRLSPPAGNTGTGQEHLELLLDHVKQSYPWWNRTDGRDHFLVSPGVVNRARCGYPMLLQWLPAAPPCAALLPPTRVVRPTPPPIPPQWVPADRGACHIHDAAWAPIKVTHFGMYSTPSNHNPDFGHRGHKGAHSQGEGQPRGQACGRGRGPCLAHQSTCPRCPTPPPPTHLPRPPPPVSPDYGCFHPLKDVLAVPYDPRVIPILNNTGNMTLKDHLARKEALFFFAGHVGTNVTALDREYS